MCDDAGMTDTYIAVVGGGEVDDDLVAFARTVGHGLAEAGVVVVCGGLGDILGAVLRGVADGGGLSLALLPGHDREGMPFEATVAIPTGLGEARNVLIARSCQAMIAVGGGYGTLSEMALAARAGVPIIGYRTWGLQPPESEGFQDPVVPVTTAEDAASIAVSLAAG